MSLQHDDGIREGLHEAMRDPDLSVTEKRERALEPGRRYLAVEHGDSSTVSTGVGETDAGASVSVHNGGPALPEHERRVLETGHETSLEHSQGLGLWLVNWIVTGLGGRVTLMPPGGRRGRRRAAGLPPAGGYAARDGLSGSRCAGFYSSRPVLWVWFPYRRSR